MNLRHTTGFCCAVALGFTVSVSAQQGSATSSGAQAGQDTSTQAAASSARTVTVTGCIRKEVDIFNTRGIGSNDEFVLTKASSGSAAVASAGTSSGADASSSSSTAPQDGEDAADRPVVTSGASLSTGSAHVSMYLLTGDREDELTRLVGRRVEVTGRLEHSGDSLNAGREDAASPGAVGTSGSSDTTRDGADEAEGAGASETAGTPSDDDNQQRAANTGGGNGVSGREGPVSSEEIAAAGARERLQTLPRVNITSFRDLGACDAQ